MQKLQNNEITRCEKYIATILVCDEILVITSQTERPMNILKKIHGPKKINYAQPRIPLSIIFIHSTTT